MGDTPTMDDQLRALEARLGRLETLLGTLIDKLERSTFETDTLKDGIQRWVTEYVSVRLQQLVPETCEHPAEPELPAGSGPLIPGTQVRCTEDVLHRLGRIPIPFVRQMVAQKVADTARAEQVALVDVPFFERAATF